jgi:hypothetical protein
MVDTPWGASSEMALSPSSSLLDAYLPTSLLPVLHSSPAATTLTAVVNPWTTAAPLPAALVSSTPLSPSAPCPFFYHGRSKQEQWRDDSSSPVSTDAPTPAKSLSSSFRDILLEPHPLSPMMTATTVIGTVVTVSTVAPAPRSQMAAIPWKAFPAAEHEWKKVESRKSHCKWLKAAAPPRR